MSKFGLRNGIKKVTWNGNLTLMLRSLLIAEMARSWRLDSDRRTSAGGGPLRNCDGETFRFLSETFPADETMFHRPSTLETRGVSVRRTLSTLRPHWGTSSMPGGDNVYRDSSTLNDFWICSWASPRRSNLLARTSRRFRSELRIGLK